MLMRSIAGVLGAMWVAYGLWCFVDPAMLRDAAGISFTSTTGSVDLRATYGGLTIAVGALLLAGALRPALTRQVLVTYAVLCAGVGTARLAGALLDAEWSAYTAIAIGFELGSVLLALVLTGFGGARVRGS